MTLCGTNEYMAPELLFDEGNYSYEVDIFSYGMVLLEILRRGKVGHLGFAERSPRSKYVLLFFPKISDCRHVDSYCSHLLTDSSILFFHNC